jgi:hypothetical protein
LGPPVNHCPIAAKSVVRLCLVKSRGGDIVKVYPGQTIYSPPGRMALARRNRRGLMKHLAMFEDVHEGQGPAAEWGGPVTGEEYGAH